MIHLDHYRGQHIAVLGLGRSGLTTARALKASGATPLCWDDQPEARAALASEGLGAFDFRAEGWGDVTTFLLSPGIPHTFPAPHPLVSEARAQGIAPTCDVNAFFQSAPQAQIIGVTGTNGKSTTCTLISHLLQTCHRQVALGGNIGIPVLGLETLPKGGIYVLELSSYQLELTPDLDLDVAVMLNITPDHLSRHGGLEGYVAAKKRIFHNRTKPIKALIGIDDPLSAQVFEELQAHAQSHASPPLTLLPVCTQPSSDGNPLPFPDAICLQDGVLRHFDKGRLLLSFDLRPFTNLKGTHNHQNAALSYGALALLGLPAEDILQGFASFPGLAHRQENVGLLEGITYINDSKATNGEATLKAIQAYEGATIYLILGGQAKEDGLSPLIPVLSHIHHAFLMGEAASAFGEFLKAHHVPFTHSHTLIQALTDAREHALTDPQPAAVILLSPACASFDQFKDFEARGNAFRDAVRRKMDDHPCP